MNWKLIFQLSMLGLIMAFGTVALIPEKVEFIFWLVIFVLVAYVIAKACTSKDFAHGFMVSILNSVYITAIHCIFVTSYNAHHPDMANMNTGAFQDKPVLFMLLSGPVFGIFFGLFQGLFAFIASKIVKPNPAQ